MSDEKNRPNHKKNLKQNKTDPKKDNLDNEIEKNHIETKKDLRFLKDNQWFRWRCEP